VAVWGIAFKPNTDDVRDSPALDIVEQLIAAGAIVRGYDPVVGENVYERLGITRTAGPMDAATDADAVVLLTEWNEFRWLDFHRLAEVMRSPVIVDARNLLDPPVLRQIGFRYEGVGRS
jgi:UDPglucose 6-dehydrogenase